MNRILSGVLPAVLLVACGTQPDPQETEAVRDYIAAADLKKVERIRTPRNMRQDYISDYFVIVEGQRQEHLVEFSRRCADLRRDDWDATMVDTRRNANYMEPKFDTIRGCTIGNIYGLTEDQAKEIRNLGDAPGDEIFLPDDDES